MRNGQGDIIGLFDGNGNIIARYSYDSWGNLLSIKDGSGSDKTNDTTFVGYKNPLRYRGYYYDSETKLYYLQSRYYNPEWGRFLNADGLVSTGQGLIGTNMFAYCNNNPAMFMDPSGHIAEAAGVLLYLLYQAAKAVFVAAVATTAAVVAAAAGAEVGKAISNSYPKTDGSSALQRPKEPFKPELKLYKGNKKNPLSFISPVPKTDKTKKQAVFTVNPYDFNPKGLIRNVYVQPGTGKNGGIIKWEMPETRVAIFEWDEDYKYGSHYHVMKIEQSNQHFGLHYYPGDLVPEPWNTTYF